MGTLRSSGAARLGLSASLLAAAVLLVVAAAPAIAAFQETTFDCGEYEGVVCRGYFTDDAGIVDDPQRIEDALARVVAEHNSPIAIVVVSDSRGNDPRDFAIALANDWGVGDPVDEDGVLVLVSLDERRIEVVTQDNVDVPGDTVAGSARSFFAAEDWEGGLSAIVGILEQALAGTLQTEADEGSSIPVGPILLAGTSTSSSRRATNCRTGRTSTSRHRTRRT
jgi:uncharacterized membrane protein YgcG